MSASATVFETDTLFSRAIGFSDAKPCLKIVGSLGRHLYRWSAMQVHLMLAACTTAIAQIRIKRRRRNLSVSRVQNRSNEVYDT